MMTKMMTNNDLFRQLELQEYTNIFFDEPTHKYTDNCGNVYKSVTTVIHDYVPVFDARKHARTQSIKTGESVESILAKWKHINKEAVNKGNLKHNELENYVKFTSKFYNAVKYIQTNDGRLRCFSIKDLLDANDVGEMNIGDFEEKLNGQYPVILKTIKYYVDKGYKIYSEINVFNPLFLISGTIDILLVKGDEFVIIDWKTNRKEILFKSGYYKKDRDGIVTNIWIPSKSYLLYPLDYIEDCNGNHYTLQLSMYALLVSLFGYTCRGLILFHIRDSYLLNKYGMPVVDSNGVYIKDDNKPVTVQGHKITNTEDDIKKLLTYHYNKTKSTINQQIYLSL